MDPTQSLRVLFNLANFVDTMTISSTDGSGEGSAAQHKQVYLWTALFKIDGDTVSVNIALNLEGTATVITTPGNHGDLGSTARVTANNEAVTIAIPPSLGRLRTVLRPIPLKSPIGNITSVPGEVGCVVLLISEGALPDDAVAKGHDAFNSALKMQLNLIIGSLGLSKQSPTPEDVAAMTKAITDAVESAIKGNLSFWEKLGALFLGQDDVVGHNLFRFSASDLVNTPATGIPLQDVFETGGAGPASDPSGTPAGDVSITESYQLNGVLFCDPLDMSLRRFLESQRLPVGQGIRSFMLPRFSTVKDWMDSTLS